MSLKSFVVAAAMAAAGSVFASTFNVLSGTTTTTNSLSETDRTYKQGDGTLVVSGSSSFKRMTVSAGTLKFSGGTATIADSTATTAYGDAMFVQSGGNTIIADGAVVTAKDGTFVDVNNGTFIVTNATFDATGIGGHVMNAFSGNNSDCWIVIETNGVLKTNILRPTGTDKAAMKDRVGIRLNRGGELRLKNFFVDAAGNNRYGRICFNGGHLYRTDLTDGGRLFNDDTTRTGWKDRQCVPTILEGGFYLHTVSNTIIYVGFESGAERDGGAHFMSGNVIRWYGNNTYNGGTWLESTGGGILDIMDGDKALGAIPGQPTTNIWAMGSNHTLYNEGNVVTIHSNRTVFIKDGVRLRTGSKNRLVFAGEIHGEIAAGNTEPTGTSLHVRGDWNGTTVLDPGAGHTNDVGHLVNYGRIEIMSGVTRLTTSTAGTGDGTALLFTSGNNSALNNYRGHLIVNGGTLVTVPQASGNRFLIANNYAHTEITNGGKIDMPMACYVNGLQSPASITIADGGELKVVNFQFANSTTNCTVDLKNGGRLISGEFWCNGAKCTVNLDGGVIGRHGSKQDIAFGLDGGASRWTGVDVFVKEGGVTFDVPSNNLWIKLPLQSAAEQDAGFRKTGSGILVVQTNCVFHGATTVASGTMQVRGHNMIPQTTLKLENRGTAAFCLYNASGTDAWQRHTQTEQTFKRIEGNGTVGYCKNVHVTESVAPSVNGYLTFEWACDLNGDLEIEGDANGCGKIYWARDVLDLTKLTLKVADFSTFDTSKAKYDASTGTGTYRILQCNAGGYTGKLNLPADWPKNWAVKYTSTGAYLRYLKGTKFVIR